MKEDNIFRITVVIPLFNKEKHIRRAIESVLKQTFQSFEIIVVDDGSTDNGAEVVRGIKDPRIRLIQQSNAGVSAARNKGIEAAKGELIAFLDADDEYKPLFLETILRLHARYPEAGIFSTAYVYVADQNKVIFLKYRTIPSAPWEGLLPNYFESVLLDSPLVWTSATAISRRVVDVVGGFPIGERLGEDLDLWMRIAFRYPVAYSTVIGACYHQDATNRAMQSGIIDPERRLAKTITEGIEHGRVSARNAVFLKEYLNKKNLEIATQFTWKGQKKEVLTILLNCRTRLFWIKKCFLFFCLLLPTRFVVFLYGRKEMFRWKFLAKGSK